MAKVAFKANTNLICLIAKMSNIQTIIYFKIVDLKGLQFYTHIMTNVYCSVKQFLTTF